MVLLYGSNGQGKTNILEAIYLLAVVKSPRASSDRDLVRREALERGEHSQVSAVVQRDGVPLRVAIGLQRASADPSAPAGATEQVGEPYRSRCGSTARRGVSPTSSAR